MIDIVFLAAIVLLPLLIPVIVIAVILGNGSWLFERFQSTLTLHEDRGLFHFVRVHESLRHALLAKGFGSSIAFLDINALFK